MSEIRRRKQRKKIDEAKIKATDGNDSNGVRLQGEGSEKYGSVWCYFNILLGTCLALYIAYRYAGYMKQLHEHDMWFSNIQASFCIVFCMDINI